MSGVKVGSRLERLERLRTTIDQEIAVERHRLALAAPPAPPPVRPFEKPKRKSPVPSGGDQLLRELGITAHDVKVWAVAQGHLDKVHRGRVAGHLVDAYALAHHLTDGGTQ